MLIRTINNNATLKSCYFTKKEANNKTNSEFWKSIFYSRNVLTKNK